MLKQNLHFKFKVSWAGHVSFSLVFSMAHFLRWRCNTTAATTLCDKSRQWQAHHVMSVKFWAAFGLLFGALLNFLWNTNFSNFTVSTSHIYATICFSFWFPTSPSFLAQTWKKKYTKTLCESQEEELRDLLCLTSEFIARHPMIKSSSFSKDGLKKRGREELKMGEYKKCFYSKDNTQEKEKGTHKSRGKND